jgi:hypothetical protein
MDHEKCEKDEENIRRERIFRDFDDSSYRKTISEEFNDHSISKLFLRN